MWGRILLVLVLLVRVKMVRIRKVVDIGMLNCVSRSRKIGGMV